MRRAAVLLALLLVLAAPASGSKKQQPKVSKETKMARKGIFDDSNAAQAGEIIMKASKTKGISLMKSKTHKDGMRGSPEKKAKAIVKAHTKVVEGERAYKAAVKKNADKNLKGHSFNHKGKSLHNVVSESEPDGGRRVTGGHVTSVVKGNKKAHEDEEGEEVEVEDDGQAAGAAVVDVGFKGEGRATGGAKGKSLSKGIKGAGARSQGKKISSVASAKFKKSQTKVGLKKPALGPHSGPRVGLPGSTKQAAKDAVKKKAKAEEARAEAEAAREAAEYAGAATMKAQRADHSEGAGGEGGGGTGGAEEGKGGEEHPGMQPDDNKGEEHPEMQPDDKQHWGFKRKKHETYAAANERAKDVLAGMGAWGGDKKEKKKKG